LADETPGVGRPASRTLRGSARRALVDVSAIREDGGFRRMWGGMVLSEFGRQVIIISMAYEVYVRTGSTLAVGLLAAVELAALLTLSLPAGALADAVDRRRLLLVTQAILATCAVILSISAAIPELPLAIVYLTAFVMFAAGAVDRPARKAALYSIVRPDLMNSAVAVDQASIQLASVAGPALGGVAIGAIGLPAAFLMAAGGFGIMLVALAGLAMSITAAQAPMRRLQGIRDGLAFVRGRPVILSTMAMDFTAMVFGFPSALFPALAVSVFGVGAPGLGLLAGAPAVGALTTSFLSGSLTSMHRKGAGVISFFLLWGVAITMFGIATFLVSFPFALLCLALAGAFDIAAAVLRASIVQGNTPDSMRGRVVSINLLASQTGPRLGDLEATTVASLTSVELSILSGGILCVVGTLLVARRFPVLRRYTDPTAAVPLSGATAP
jgi:MFS family permease